MADDAAVSCVDQLKNTRGSTLGETLYSARYDLNADGVVNIADVALLRHFFGRSCEVSV